MKKFKNIIVITLISLVVIGCFTAVVIGPGKYGRKSKFDSPDWLKYYCLISLCLLVLFLLGLALGEAKRNPSAWLVYSIIPASIIVIWVGYYLKNGHWGIF